MKPNISQTLKRNWRNLVKICFGLFLIFLHIIPAGCFTPLTLVNQTTAFDLSFYDILVPQKVNLSKVSDDVIACDLWIGPAPNQTSWQRLWYRMSHRRSQGGAQGARAPPPNQNTTNDKKLIMTT